MAYSGHGPNLTNFMQNLNPGFAEYQQETEAPEDDIQKFIVDDWSMKTDHPTSNRLDDLQVWEGFGVPEQSFDGNNSLFLPFDTTVPQLYAQQTLARHREEAGDSSIAQFGGSPSSPTSGSFDVSPVQQPASGKDGFTLSPEDSEKARKAADEDKRRRNTAASARFRHKKKDQEREMHKKVQAMATEIAELRMEVETLKVEKKALEKVLALRDQHTTVSEVKEESSGSEGPRSKRVRFDG